MKMFVLFLFLSLFVITCYADDKTSITNTLASSDKSDTALQAFNALQAGLSQEDFESVIDKRFSATHRFYNDLSTQHRNTVYAFYQEDQDFMKIRNKILALYFGLG